MKLIRTPSLKKSFSASTTGSLKRQLKRTVNPYYGKKGMGYITNPKRAIKNKIYHATTIDARDLLKTPARKTAAHPHRTVTPQSQPKSQPRPKSAGDGLCLAICFGFLGAYRFYIGQPFYGFLYLFTGGFLGVGWIYDIIVASIALYNEKKRYEK